MLTLALQNIPIYEYAPTEIKSALVGAGRATKEQVNSMVKILLNYSNKLEEDQSDALAAAICHANTKSWSQTTSSKKTDWASFVEHYSK